MSWAATNWARTQATGSTMTKAILLLLADLADENHSCFPGQERLARDAEMHVNSVATHVRKLEQLGLLRRERRTDAHGRRTSDRYFLAVDEPAPPTPAVGGPTHISEAANPQLSAEPNHTLGVEEPLVEPLEEGGAAKPANTAPVVAQIPTPNDQPAGPPAATSGWDTHGPLHPYCPEHPPWVPDQPCGRCATAREAYPAAERARRREADKAARARAATQREAEQARRQATTADPESVKRHAAKLRAQLRQTVPDTCLVRDLSKTAG